MKRTKTKTHRTSVKQTPTQTLNFAVYGCNENASWSFLVDVSRKSIKKWPKIFRGLADLIESGELQKELARECEEYLQMRPLQAYLSPKKAKRR